MKIRTLLLALVVGAPLFSCTNDEDVPTEQEGNTYLNLDIQLPASVTTKADPDQTKYNDKGTYEGNDSIKTVDVYISDIAPIRLEAKQFSVTAEKKIVPLEPIKTKAGEVTVYVVLNDPNPLAASQAENGQLPIAGLAKIEDNKDVILMNGKKTATVTAGVSKQQAAAGANRVSVEVTRVASRVIVTGPVDFTIEGAGKITNIKYAVAQGEKEVFAYPQGGSEGALKSVAYDYVPTEADYSTTASTHYDYSGLNSPEALDANDKTDYQKLKGSFLFENTHEFVAIAEGANYKYRKGNTAYVLIKGTFTPEGETTGTTFYVGATDGKVYDSIENAQAAVPGQKVRTYEDGEVLYYAWLNPDVIEKPYNSPVVRNNIYHIHINSFKSIGLNWNPLYPEDPDSTTPENPDPKPTDPNEPDDTPIKPTDPLSMDETYLSVEVTVRPWLLHSYDVDLGF